MSHAPPGRRGERGAVLLALVLVLGAMAGASASLVARASAAAREVAARRDALCARQAALGGLALGAPTPADGSAAALAGGRASFLAVALVRRSATWCVLRSTAACGTALRTVERTLPDASACDASPSRAVPATVALVPRGRHTPRARAARPAPVPAHFAPMPSAETRGFFVTLEGVEGSGKSTQARRLEAWLTSAGRRVVLTREPGGTDVTVEIRRILADPESRLDSTAELMLFLADRAQHVATVIRPALDDGCVVVCDRYSDSTLAYQGYGRGHELAWLEDLNRRASHGVEPALTLWIDCAVEVGLARAKRRAGGPGDRFEIEPDSFHHRIRRGFADLADRFPARIVRIDGSLDEEGVAAACRGAVASRLGA